MNWDAVSFDWNQVRAFLATVEEGSFSAAARALGTTQPTIGRQIAELEAKLAVSLLERSVRGPTLTEAGRTLLHHVRAMNDAATMISMAAAGQSADITGEVTVTATDLLSAGILPEILVPLRERAPGLRINVLPSNTVENLLQRDADIAVRHVRPSEPELIARHIGDFRAGLFAATTYLDRAGRPRTNRDVADHAFVGAPDTARLMTPLQNLGISLRPENFVLKSGSGVVVWEFVQAGYGISMLPEALCTDVPGIERVLPDLPPLQFPIWLVTHRELQTSRRIRLVFDLLADGLTQAARSVQGAD